MIMLPGLSVNSEERGRKQKSIYVALVKRHDGSQDSSKDNTLPPFLTTATRLTSMTFVIGILRRNNKHARNLCTQPKKMQLSWKC